MPKGWKTFVYQTDTEPEKFRGFFYDADEAQTWINKQTEGTFEISDKGPAQRKETA